MVGVPQAFTTGVGASKDVTAVVALRRWFSFPERTAVTAMLEEVQETLDALVPHRAP